MNIKKNWLLIAVLVVVILFFVYNSRQKRVSTIVEDVPPPQPEDNKIYSSDSSLVAQKISFLENSEYGQVLQQDLFSELTSGVQSQAAIRLKLSDHDIETGSQYLNDWENIAAMPNFNTINNSGGYNRAYQDWQNVTSPFGYLWFASVNDAKEFSKAYYPGASGNADKDQSEKISAYTNDIIRVAKNAKSVQRKFDSMLQNEAIRQLREQGYNIA